MNNQEKAALVALAVVVAIGVFTAGAWMESRVSKLERSTLERSTGAGRTYTPSGFDLPLVKRADLSPPFGFDSLEARVERLERKDWFPEWELRRSQLFKP